MGRLGPLTSQGLGRSPYDDVVPGEGLEDPRSHQQQYDERGRPINPETKRINRDVVRSHNEVMMVIGVAEPENGIVEAQAEAARRHRQYEDRIGRRLLLVGGVLETAAVWGVNGMRQRILLYKPYSQTTFYGMFQLAWSQQSLPAYFLGGLPSFVVSTILEQFAVSEVRKYPVIQYATTYIRLHLAIYTFFQRSRIIPYTQYLPNWRFFIPGSSISPIPLPPVPSSFRPRTLLQWLGAAALGVAPFAGFYLYTKIYSLMIRTLRFSIHRLLPRPYNANRRRAFQAAAFLPDAVPIEIRTEEPAEEPSADGGRRQSTTPSLRGGGSNGQPGAAAGQGQDDFASDEEDTEIISATLISFDVEASDPMPSEPTTTTTTAASGPDTAATSAGPNTPGIWSAELRPNLTDTTHHTNTNTNSTSNNNNTTTTDDHHDHNHNHNPSSSFSSTSGPADGPPGGSPEPIYRETVLTRLPAVLATDVLAIMPARLLMTPLAAVVWLRLARPYVARMAAAGASLAGAGVAAVGGMGGVVGGVGMPGVVVAAEGVMHTGAGWWWGLASGRALANLLGLEMLLAVMHGEAWAVVMLVAERFRFGEEEWNEMEGVGREEEEGGEGAVAGG